MKKHFRFCLGILFLSSLFFSKSYGSTHNSIPKFSIHTGLGYPQYFGFIGTEWSYKHNAINFGIGCKGENNQLNISNQSFGIRRYDNKDKASIGFNIATNHSAALTLGYKFKLNKDLHTSLHSGFGVNDIKEINSDSTFPYFGINVGYEL